MKPVAQIIEQLWDTGQAVISTDYDHEFQAVFKRPHGFFDIVLYQIKKPVGFITLKHERDARYSIVNDTRLNPHPGFKNTPGDGIEVMPQHRKRSIGAALLSLGIGVVQRDFQASGQDAEFEVIASRITYLGLGCYRNFGFTIREGMWISDGSYYDAEKVPEIKILKGKASRLKRLYRRIRVCP